MPWPYDDGHANATNKNGTDMNPACKDSGCCGATDPHYCLRDVQPGSFLLDQSVRNIAVERLNVAIDNWNKTKQPFFVGMGTHRPHLGWEFPIEFEIPELEVPEAVHKEWPHDVPHLHFHEVSARSTPVPLVSLPCIVVTLVCVRNRSALRWAAPTLTRTASAFPFLSRTSARITSQTTRRPCGALTTDASRMWIALSATCWRR